MTLTKAQAAAVDTLLDYLTETIRPGHMSPPKHGEAHQALVLLAVAAGHDGHDADARLAKTWRDRLNVQAYIGRLTKQAAIKDQAIESLRRTLNRNLDRSEQLTRQLAELAPHAEAGKQAAAEAAKREYYHGRCDDCGCCSTAQCSEGRCPENSVGESTCPCTCY